MGKATNIHCFRNDSTKELIASAYMMFPGDEVPDLTLISEGFLRN